MAWTFSTAGLQRARQAVPLDAIRPYVVDVGNDGDLSGTGDYRTTPTTSRTRSPSRFPRRRRRGAAAESCHPTIYVLSDTVEGDVTIGSYRKSQLFLVSNAFEGRRDVPLLGMERYVSARGEMQDRYLGPNFDVKDLRH